MKNQKIILVCALMIVFLLIMTNLVQATNSNDMVVNPPIGLNNEATTPANNQQGTLNVSGGNNIVPVNNTQNSANNTLPDTGVAEDTTLFVFIAICIISAVYAFVKIKNYKNI